MQGGSALPPISIGRMRSPPYRWGVTATVRRVPVRVRAVLFDFDGVIRHWDPASIALIETTHGLPAGAIHATALTPERLQPALTGAVTDAEWRNGVRGELVARFGPAGSAAVDEWSALPGRVDSRAVALVARVRARAAVALVTNATTRLDQEIVECGLDEVFPVVVSSSVVGVAKPDPAIFRCALDAVGVDADACAYVDDDPGNVSAGAALGLHAIQFTGVAEADARLSELLA